MPISRSTLNKTSNVCLRTGVYCIRNTTNGKLYVGSAAVSFKARWNSHRNALRRGEHAAKHLQSSWNKYGEDKFEFLVLEYSGSDTRKNKD